MSQSHQPDVELGVRHGAQNASPSGSHPMVAGVLPRLRSFLKTWYGRGAQNDQNRGTYQIEDYRKGYPRFSALMAAHDSFQVFRLFSRTRTRLLLLAQDRVAELESKLDRFDRDETYSMFLASSRRDSNDERRAVFSDLTVALKNYDEMMERSVRAFTLGAAHPRDIANLQNWNVANGCISREEIAFLNHHEDPVSISPLGDNLASWLERSVSEKILSFSNRGRSDSSRDAHVHIYTQKSTLFLTRTIITPILVTLVVIPIVICNALDSTNARIAVTTISTSIFLTVLSLLTQAKVLELAVAGATYTTVLVVFISEPTIRGK